ncbi:MAG TPA: ATP-binding protein [Chloroflexota bacterium]|nr:ATP-binding protein [Chloroflexota bacterium]
MATGAETDLEKLGATVRERRRELGLTQAQVAERLGWSQERISALENGKYGLPSLPLLAHLAEAIQLPLGALMEAVGFSVAEPAHSLQPSGSDGSRADRILRYTLQQLLEIDAVTVRDAMNQAGDLIARAMGADKVDLFLYEEETGTLVALGTSNTEIGRAQIRVGLNRVPIANGGRQVQVFETGEPFFTGHADQDPEVSRGIVHALGVRSMYVVPLQVDGKIRGILASESTHPDRFGPAEREFLDAASRWVAIVAHRAQLHEAVTRQAIDETRRLVAEEMLETVAHDLGNQITPVKGQLDLLLRRLVREDNAGAASQAERISESLDRLRRMVRDLLDASRLQGGVFSLSRRPTNIMELINNVVADVEVDSTDIQVRGPERLTASVDPMRITQALHNLIGNAIQHTEPGVPIMVNAGRRSGEETEWAVIDIHDEGPGIASDLLPHLFTRHASRGDSSGLGLGLYLARGIADAHGGDLTVDSSPGAGTTFTMKLPIDGASRPF